MVESRRAKTNHFDDSCRSKLLDCVGIAPPSESANLQLLHNGFLDHNLAGQCSNNLSRAIRGAQIDDRTGIQDEHLVESGRENGGFIVRAPFHIETVY